MQVMERLTEQFGGNEDQIVVPLATMKKFFDVLLDEIIKAVQSTLDRVSRSGSQCDYMLIVGGFGGSPYLITRLRQAFNQQVLKEVVCSGVPSQAVLKGNAGPVLGILCGLPTCNVQTCALQSPEL